MALCSSLEGTEREIATASVAEAENIAEAMLSGGRNKVHVVSNGEGHISNRGNSSDYGYGGASDNKNSSWYCFGASTITLGHIKEMVEK
jgi:hypothetical protein